ncbi:MAG: energy-coupling factor ABC transporter permease [Neisseria sp.]|uniref:energy-coupling factor ABC transporter permease n=1 Tax=Neisseria sp. TaxID=192066 RepID=UPI0026DD7696|nr:energy-coupling factor ABC transporter permease [Neisseria sp.]MDO4641595.1 energy-coupling factor ABC transporter permease [Neisseria sp.]
MNFLAAWFEPAWFYIADIVLVLLLAAFTPKAWAVLRYRPRAAAAALLWLALLWSLRANIGGGQLTGMSYHLLGMSLATLMLGAPAAFWIGSLLLLPYLCITNGLSGLNTFALNALFVLLPPVMACRLLLSLAQRHLSPNLFIYIFVNGFIAAALGMLLTGALIVALLEWSGTFPNVLLWHTAFKVFFLIAWGEAFLSGIFSAIFVALVPTMLGTFDDARYLNRKADIWK